MLIEYTKEPLAIGARKPRFSWEVPLAGRGRWQSAYQLLVATDSQLLEPGKADLWDSGKVVSRQSVNIEYAGVTLPSNADCYWSVQVWDENDTPCGFGEPSYFGTAFFGADDWQAQWIGVGPSVEPKFVPYSISQQDASQGLQLSFSDMQKLQPDLRDYNPETRAPLLRKAFRLDKGVSRARVFVSGLGLFELRLNGEKVGDDVLATPRTDFDKRVYYSVYDVTSTLKAGENVLGLILGNGWFNGQKKHWHWQAPWFGEPRALVQLEITHNDGTKERVVSDASWQGDWSPITLNCIYDGEDYDARLEQGGWDTAGFDASHWTPVNLVAPPKGTLIAVEHPLNRVVKRFAPVRVCEPDPGVFVFDMGTVMTGWAKLNLPQGLPGQTIVLRYAELQHENGMINPGTGAGARQADLYTMNGSACASYEPRFTYHGFRYVELTGYPGTPELDTLEACFVCSDAEPAGSFECGHELINKIHCCTVQSQRCNLQMGVPTDDTQREERLGWCGDAWSYAQESFYNLDMAGFWTKWIADCCDQQDPKHGAVGYICPLPGWGEDLVWSAAFVLIPWWHYIHYGDKQILEKTYPFLRRYLAYLEGTGKKTLPDLATAKPESYLFPKVPLVQRYPAPEDHGYLQHSRFGDHLATHEGGSGMAKDQPRSMATAFYHYDAIIMARIAEVLGYMDDAAEYRDLAGNIAQTFHAHFYDATGGYYDIGCQSAQALAICFDIVPESLRARLMGYLASSVNFRQRRITSGYAGTKWVIEALAQAERHDVIWARAISSDYPSWGYMLADDKTTICENWHGSASQCHTTLGAAIDEWFYWGLAGIRPDEAAPGFEHVIIKPYLPTDLPWAKASVKTARGSVVSEWKQEKGQAELTISIPANSSATVYLLCRGDGDVAEGGTLVASAPGVKSVSRQTDACVLEVGSGTYCFSFPV